MVKSNPNDTRVYGKKYQEMCRKSQAKYHQTVKHTSNNTKKNNITIYGES